MRIHKDNERVTYAGAADNISQVQQLLLALTPQRAIPANRQMRTFHMFRHCETASSTEESGSAKSQGAVGLKMEPRRTVDTQNGVLDAQNRAVEGLKKPVQHWKSAQITPTSK
jgi:hypothetical protein